MSYQPVIDRAVTTPDGKNLLLPPTTRDAPPGAPAPKTIQLPLGGTVSMYTREQLAMIYHCTRGELSGLLITRRCPMPIRVDGLIVWYPDEVHNSMAQVNRALERWRRR